MKSVGEKRLVRGFGNKKKNNKENAMCTVKLMKGILVTSLVSLVWLTGTQTGLATTATPANCLNFASIGMDTYCVANPDTNTPTITGQTVVPGQTIYYQVPLNRAPTQCCVTGGVVRVTTPDGVDHFVGEVGATLICNPADAVGGSIASITFPTVAYTVREADMGVQHGISACDPASISVQASCTYTGGVNFCNGTCSATASTDNCNPTLIPRLSVTKLVACTTGNVCNANIENGYSSSASGAKDSDTNPKFCYSITLTNSGTAPLSITNVTDSVLGNLTASFPAALLPNSGTTIFVGPQTETTTTMNTVTVFAFEPVSCIQQGTNVSSSATANVVNTPITCQVRFIQNNELVTGQTGPCTNCEVTVASSPNPIAVVVRVTNTGGNGQNIVNGTIQVGSATFNVPGPITPGNFVDTTITNLPGATPTACLSYTADVVFHGADTDSCPPLDTSCSSSIRICGTPNVCIIKLVKCLTDSTAEGECETGECSHDLSLYAPSATGVKDAGFCYGIVIENCGSLDLTGVTVVDSQLGSLGGFPSSLAIGQSATNFFQKSYPGMLGMVRNTATVSGNSSGGTVSANTNAVVTLLNPSIMCQKSVSVDGGPFSSGGSVQVEFGSLHSLTFAVNVCNNGSVALQNVQVIDTGTSGCPASTNVISSLAQGACTNIILCTIEDVGCPPTTTINNIVNVSAEVSSTVCSINPSDCQTVKTSSSCNNSITLTCVAPGACRTTGGGKQYRSENQVCPLDVRYVTHGGQVGAAFGQASVPDCESDTGYNNPCIRGEYTHVRHFKGGLRGNFHAAGNGNQHDYDSLMCACLPCEHTDIASPFGGCHPADRVYADANPTVPGKHFGLCNPGDRICGPEPRPAPANKICFSGVGDYVLTRGHRTPNKVVFRVDLEDRSEPGGAHPKGGKAPPDRYRMRMWFIDPSQVDSPAVKALRDAVACHDPLDERVIATLPCVGGATPAPDIDDGGDLDRGNRQIHPNTGATCD
jgi:hypothetical protein